VCVRACARARVQVCAVCVCVCYRTQKSSFNSRLPTLWVLSTLFTPHCPAFPAPDSLHRQTRASRPPFAFSRAVPGGVLISTDGLVVTRVGTVGWQSALVEPAVSSAERCYAEWVIEEADANCYILIGVTDLDAAPPAGLLRLCDKPGSRMYACYDSRAHPGYRDWGATGRCSRGDRVGLMLERGNVLVYVNGARIGPGPMATDVPQQVGTECISTQ
jgi:hypothetical protein